MKKTKKLVAMLLAMILVLGMLAGCGGNSEGDTKEPEGGQSETDDTNKEQPTEEDDTTDSRFAEEVNLVYVIPASSDTYPGLDAIEEAVNKITKEKINATITFELIPLEEYTDKMNMKFISGEEFDVCFTGAWNPYLPAVSQGAYAELTEDVLNTYAPETMALLNSAVWDAIRVNGKVYGVPIQQIYVRQTGVRVPKELAEKYDFDVTTVTTLDDVDDFVATVKENEPDVVPIYTQKNALLENCINYLGFDCIISYDTPGAAYFNAETPVIVNQFESEEFKALCEKVREWNQAGYLPADAVTGADSVRDAVWGISFDPAHKPGGDATESAAKGYEIVGTPIGDCAMTTSAVQATINAVSATSENVERAVAFINLLNTDPEILNLLCHGIEGVDYEFVGDPSQGLIQSISDYPGMHSFLIGNVFNEYYTDESQIGTWEETAEINNNAKASCILGFAFDSEKVSTQVAQCSAVVSEYLPSLMCGAVDVEVGLTDFQNALKQAGVDDIITEMQTQVDAWLQTK